jgi:hypothetical protein
VLAQRARGRPSCGADDEDEDIVLDDNLVEVQANEVGHERRKLHEWELLT